MVAFINRVISVNGKKTTMRLTDVEWMILDNICYKEKMKRKTLLEAICAIKNTELGLTPSVRLFALLYLYMLSNKNLASSGNLSKILRILH